MPKYQPTDETRENLITIAIVLVECGAIMGLTLLLEAAHDWITR